MLLAVDEDSWQKEVSRRSAIKEQEQKEGVYICTHEELSTTKTEILTTIPTKI